MRALVFAASLVALIAPALAQAPGPAPATLIERTLAIVGSAIVTQSDVTLARTLGLIDSTAAASPDAALTALVDRWLMLHEVARFAPAEPASAAVDAQLAAVRGRAGDDAALARALAASGREASFLTTWVRDDLRIAAYLQQRFASTGAPAEADIAAYLRTHDSELAAAGLDGDAATAAARTRLVDERRRALVEEWLADLRRRTPVVTFAPQP